jgi:DNA-binding CsgD family transcriptional regulator
MQTQLSAKGSTLSWLDDAGGITRFELIGIDRGFEIDYESVRQWDPVSPEEIIRQRYDIRSLSRWPGLEQRQYNLFVYRRFLMMYGFQDDINFVLSDADNHPVAILTVFSNKQYLSDAIPVTDYQKFLSSYITQHPWVRQTYQHRKLRREHGFSLRELDVFELIRDGASNSEIAKALGVSLATVKAHVMNAMRKADVTSRSKLVAFSNQL